MYAAPIIGAAGEWGICAPLFRSLHSGGLGLCGPLDLPGEAAFFGLLFASLAQESPNSIAFFHRLLDKRLYCGVSGGILPVSSKIADRR